MRGRKISVDRDRPELDPKSRGISKGSLRLSFIKTVDEIAAEKVLEITRKVLPAHRECPGLATAPFAVLRGISTLARTANIPLEVLDRGPAEYVGQLVHWAQQNNLDCEWYLDSLHHRMGFLASADLYQKQRIEAVKAARPFTSLLEEYGVIKTNREWILERRNIVDDYLRMVNLSVEIADVGKRLSAAVVSLKSKSGDEITALEDIWKRESVIEFERDSEALHAGALQMSYSFGFNIDLNRWGFEFAFRPWQFNEESKEGYRKQARVGFENDLTQYLTHVEAHAIDTGHYKNVRPRTRYGVTPDDRMKIFVLYQVLGLSPEACLIQIDNLSENQDFTGFSASAVTKIVQELSCQLGLAPRPSKTKRKNRIIPPDQ
jgi:hypothetical protein